MKPISTHELTIGNLVYYKIPGNPKPILIKVSSIISKVQEDDANYIEALGFGWIPFKPTTIKPIPLTRARLEKNGFKFNEEALEWFKEWDDKTKEVYYNSKVFKTRNGFYLIKRGNIFWITDHVLLKPIRYVHEFQNVLKSFGHVNLADNFKLR